jgi:hypothetical protein
MTRKNTYTLAQTSEYNPSGHKYYVTNWRRECMWYAIFTALDANSIALYPGDYQGIGPFCLAIAILLIWSYLGQKEGVLAIMFRWASLRCVLGWIGWAPAIMSIYLLGYIAWQVVRLFGWSARK